MSVSEERIHEIVREEIDAALGSQASVLRCRGRRIDVIGDEGEGIPKGIHLIAQDLSEIPARVSFTDVNVGVVDGDDSALEGVHNPIVGGAS